VVAVVVVAVGNALTRPRLLSVAAAAVQAAGQKSNFRPQLSALPQPLQSAMAALQGPLRPL
jgi:hypothetical protein